MKARHRMADAVPASRKPDATRQGLRPALTAAIAMLLCHSCAKAPDGLPHAIRQVRAADKSSTTDITLTVKRFIPPGSVTDERLTFLRGQGFRVLEIAERRQWGYDGGDRAFMTSRQERWWFFGSEEWRINIYSDHGKIIAVRGFIFVHSL